MKYVCNVCGYVYDEEAGDPEKVLKGEVNTFKKVLRVLSVNGCDISEFDANWKG